MENNMLTVPPGGAPWAFARPTDIDFSRPWGCHVYSIEDFNNLSLPKGAILTLQTFRITCGHCNEYWLRNAAKLLDKSKELKHIVVRGGAHGHFPLNILLYHIMDYRVFETVYIDCACVRDGEQLRTALGCIQVRKLELDGDVGGLRGLQVLDEFVGDRTIWHMGAAKIDYLTIRGLERINKRSQADFAGEVADVTWYGNLTGLCVPSITCCDPVVVAFLTHAIRDGRDILPPVLELTLDMTEGNVRGRFLQLLGSTKKSREIRLHAVEPDAVFEFTDSEVELFNVVIHANPNLQVVEIEGLCDRQRVSLASYLQQRTYKKMPASKNVMKEHTKWPEENGCFLS
jgi:hypothetical protein